jgi:MFS transporter, DHA2 family, multidrug resistance protein
VFLHDTKVNGFLQDNMKLGVWQELYFQNGHAAGTLPISLGLGAIASLGTDLVVGSAPATKSGAASAISETVQELGLAVGVATLGSLATTVYRDQIGDYIPANLSNTISLAVRDSLWGASSVAHKLPHELIEQAKMAFTLGLNLANLVGAVVILILAVLSAVALRHIGTIGNAD